MPIDVTQLNSITQQLLATMQRKGDDRMNAAPAFKAVLYSHDETEQVMKTSRDKTRYVKCLITENAVQFYKLELNVFGDCEWRAYTPGGGVEHFENFLRHVLTQGKVEYVSGSANMSVLFSDKYKSV